MSAVQMTSPDNYHMNLPRSVSDLQRQAHRNSTAAMKHSQKIGASAGGLLSMKWFFLTKNAMWTGYLTCGSMENNQWIHQNRPLWIPLASTAMWLAGTIQKPELSLTRPILWTGGTYADKIWINWLYWVLTTNWRYTPRNQLSVWFRIPILLSMFVEPSYGYITWFYDHSLVKWPLCEWT